VTVSLPDPVSAGHDAPGSARLRRQVLRLRALLVVTLVLTVIVGVWSVVGMVSVMSQLSSLEAKVDALTSELSSANESRGPGVSPGDAAAPSAPTAPSTADAAELSGDVESPAGTVTGGAIVVGDPQAKKVVEVYVDYQCPYCQRWETEIGTALMERALQPGSGLAVKQYNMAFLGEANRSLDPPGASARAAAAAACVLDGDGAEAFVDFNAAIYAAPGGADPATRFDTASLLGLAGGIGASGEALACIEQERFVPFISATTQAAFARGVTGTPTVLVNGKVIADSFGDPQLLALLQM
jgi:protein-disulfide isomerase